MSQLRPSVAARFAAFVLERYPFAAAAAASAFEVLADSCGDPVTPDALERSRAGLPQALRRALASPPPNLPETTPAVCASVRWTAAVDELVEACDGFLRRAAIAASLTADERLEILRGMALTRATDNRLKAFFTGGEVRYGDAAFQGKGFRSLGQEAIYAAGIECALSPCLNSLVGDGITLADICFATELTLFMNEHQRVRQLNDRGLSRILHQNVRTDYPLMMAHFARLAEHPNFRPDLEPYLRKLSAAAEAGSAAASS